MRTPLSLQSVHSITFKKKVSLVKKKKNPPFKRFVYLSYGRKENEWADYWSSSPLLCILDGSLVSGNGAWGPLMRETGVHLCGLNERREPTLFGLFKILWEKRNVLFPDREGK